MSKYTPLLNYLSKLQNEKITLTYKDMERIINNRLPPSAYQYHAWWKNWRGSHVQAYAWLDAGYQTLNIDLGNTVTFVKVENCSGSFIVTAWKGGNPDYRNPAGYGLKLSETDRDRNFDKQWNTVVLELQGESQPLTVNIAKKSFWNRTCRELISQDIGKWMIKNNKAPWTKYNPPKMKMTRIKDNRFKVEFIEPEEQNTSATAPIKQVVKPHAQDSVKAKAESKGQLNLQGVPFYEVRLCFTKIGITNVFAEKNDTTVKYTVQSTRYTKLMDQVYSKYPRYLNLPLGEFLLELKNRQDPFYLEFLNEYGDAEYALFKIENSQYLDKRGLYLWYIDGKVMYIGRCRDSFGRRINQGYGRIHPKNCYIDGQSTNCRLNNLIFQHRRNTRFFVSPMDDEQKIIDMERKLIPEFDPPWNKQ